MAVSHASVKLPALRAATILLLVVSLLLLSVPQVRGATTTGVTDALVNAEQLTRDASSAIPVVGFNMTSTGGETLHMVSVRFMGAGFDPGDDQDLRRLDVDARKSGVGLYRDDGTVDDVLDAADTPIILDGIDWAGSVVTMDLTGGSEPVPTAVSGLYHWFIVIRTSAEADTLQDGDEIVVVMEANSIIATSDGGFVSQPSADVISQSLTVRLTRGVNLIGGDEWIGPEEATVNALAPLGFTLVDGGVATNWGIDDRIVEIQVNLIEEDGVVTSRDLQPLDPDGSVSGLALYADDGTVDDEWDPADTPILLDDITPRVFSFGGVVLTLTPQAPGIPVPDAPTGEVDFLLVVRTRDIVTGDEFRLQIGPLGIAINGTLAAQSGSVDARLRTPLSTDQTTEPSGRIRADSTPPRLRNEVWLEDSRYLLAKGLVLYFGPFMTSPEGALVSGQTRDDESGLALVTYSQEPSLAGSPAPQTLTGSGIWRTFGGLYLFDAASTDDDSPVVVTVTDRVGNAISTVDTGTNFQYVLNSSPVMILPDPGWVATPGTPTWVDASGKLWFSNMIEDVVTVQLTVHMAALSGAGLKNATASLEASLAGGPDPGSISYDPVEPDDVWTNTYEISASSTDSSSPVVIWAEDHLGNSAALAFEFGLDSRGPDITFLEPSPFQSLRGDVLVRVDVVDADTAVDSVDLQVDALGPVQPMFFDGQYYFAVVSTALFEDGAHRLIVRATDVLGNVHAEALEVFFENALDDQPPVISVLSPVEGQFVSGTLSINATASDDFLVSFEYRVDGGPWRSVDEPLDTTRLRDGEHTLTFRAVDAAGLQSLLQISILVDNTDPTAVFVLPAEGSEVEGIVTVLVSAEDANGLASVTVEIAGIAAPMTYNRATGYYEYTFDSTDLADGEYVITVTVTDASGRTAVATRSIRVSNQEPLGTRILQTLQENALLLLVLLLVLLFAAVLILLRSGRVARWLGRA